MTPKLISLRRHSPTRCLPSSGEGYGMGGIIMTLYKLTDKHDCTYDGCQWGPGVTNAGTGEGGLCGPGWIHAYTSPLLAVMLNPVHARFDLETAHLWKLEGEVALDDCGLKVGCLEATTTERIPLPVVTLTQRVALGILVSLEVCRSPHYIRWAKDWLSGKDRTRTAAAEAAAEAWVAVWVAEAWAWVAAWAAAKAAEVAAAKAVVAAEVAVWAAGASKPLDLVALAEKAMEVPE